MFTGLVAANAASYFGIAAALVYAGIGKVMCLSGRVKGMIRRFAPDGRYLLTSLLSGVLSVHMALLVVAMPLWFVRHTAIFRAHADWLLFAAAAVTAGTLMRYTAGQHRIPPKTGPANRGTRGSRSA